MMSTIEAPRSPSRPARKGGVNWEKWGWIYMRGSGVLLVVLIFGHLFVNLVLGQGIRQIDFAFIGGKYSNPFWQVWDLVMLWLALIHGGNGMRTLVNDYASNPTVNRLLKFAIFGAVAVLILLGTLVIFTFNPCPTGAPASEIASFCPVK
jgi:succinate dehydrogenase / fumarate reductase membrane anchor subunit